MFGVRLSKMGSASKLGLIAKAIGILRSYGADAHVYLPGIGTVSGLTAGNYLDSAGTTAATVDNPVGLSLDALQAMTLGGELVTNSSLLTVDASTASCSDALPNLSLGFSATSGKTYLVSYVATAKAGYCSFRIAGSSSTTPPLGLGPSSPLTGSTVLLANASGVVAFITDNTGCNWVFDNISVREIPGIHATQATTANKPILRLNSGKYSWQFDGSNDSLSLSAPLFQMSDDHCVIAGANTNKTGAGVIFSQNGGITPRMQMYSASVWLQCDWTDDAGVLSSSNVAGISVSVPFVASMRKTGNAKSVRLNGIQSAVNNTAVGSATFLHYRIGSNAISGTDANFFQGSLYPVIAIKGTLSDSDLLVLERFVGQLSGVQI